MMKRFLGLAAACGLVGLVGCGPVATTTVKPIGEKVKEGAKDFGDKVKEGAEKVGEKAKEGAKDLSENFKVLTTNFSATAKKDYEIIEAKLKELFKKKDEPKDAATIKALNEQYSEASGLFDKLTQAMKTTVDSIKDGTGFEKFKATVEPLIAQLKAKLGIAS